MWLEIEMTKRGAFPAELEATIKVEWGDRMERGPNDLVGKQHGVGITCHHPVNAGKAEVISDGIVGKSDERGNL